MLSARIGGLQPASRGVVQLIHWVDCSADVSRKPFSTHFFQYDASSRERGPFQRGPSTGQLHGVRTCLEGIIMLTDMIKRKGLVSFFNTTQHTRVLL